MAARRAEAIGPVPLHDQVVRSLMGAIVRGELPPGAYLPTINALSEQLGISQTIVRQALKAIEAKGMVEIRHGVGTCVTPEHRWNAFDSQLFKLRAEEGKLLDTMLQLLEVRRMLEVEIAGFATVRADEDDLRAMREALQRQERALRDPAAFIEADMAFHEALLLAARNDILCTMLAPVNDLFRHSREMTLAAVSGMADRAFAQHRGIYERVTARDEPGARAAMREHLLSTEGDLRHMGAFELTATPATHP